MKKTVIVEFNGLAGLGKTTVANDLIGELRSDGYKVIGSYRHSIFHSLHPILCIPYSFSLYRAVKRYADSIIPYKKDRVYLHWTNHFVRMYKSIEKHSDADFAIIDEAIIQFLVAMGFDDKLPQSELLYAIVEIIKSMGVSFVRVDCENNIKAACERISSRPPKGMYYESWPQKEIEAQLQAEAHNFETLRDVFSKVYTNQIVIPINTLRDAKDNARIIKEVILKLV